MFSKTTIQPDMPSLLLLGITDTRGEKSQKNRLKRNPINSYSLRHQFERDKQKTKEFLEGDYWN